VVEAVGDRFEPPMLRKISVEHATKFAEALAKGAPNRSKIAWTAISGKAPELICRPRGSSKISA
jgi:pyruvate dehydrogenase (quinone)